MSGGWTVRKSSSAAAAAAAAAAVLLGSGGAALSALHTRGRQLGAVHSLYMDCWYTSSTYTSSVFFYLRKHFWMQLKWMHI